MRRKPSDELNSPRSASCPQAQARLLDYLDGALGAAERTFVETHLAACAACREALAQQQFAEAALTAARHAIPSAGDLRPDFYARLAAQNAARSRTLARRGWIFAAPTCAAALLTVFLWHPPASRQTETPQRITLRDAPQPEQTALLPSAPEQHTQTLRPAARKVSRVATDKPIDTPDAAPIKAPIRPGQIGKPQSLASVYRRGNPKLPALRQQESPHNQTNTYALMLAKPAPSSRQDAPLYDGALYYKSEGTVRAKLDAPAVLSPNALLPRGYAQRDGNLQKHLYGMAMDKNQFFFRNETKSSAMDNLAATATGRPTSMAASGAVENLSNGKSHGTTFGAQLDADRMADRINLTQQTTDPDVVDLQVTDEVRGFECSTRIAGTVEQKSDGEILTLEAESGDGT